MDWNVWWPRLGPIFTLVLGYLGSLVTEWYRDRRRGSAERRARTDALERDSLLEIQERIFELGTAMVAIASRWQADSFDYDSAMVAVDQWTERKTRVSILASRVKDANLRQQVIDLSAGFQQTLSRVIEEDGDLDSKEMWVSIQRLNSQIGVRLREVE